MKEFLINNIAAVSSFAGLVLFMIMLNLFNVVEGTKFEVLHRWYFIILIIIGVIASSEAIGKWIIK